MDDFESVVSEMMAGASQPHHAGTGACADIPLLSLDGKYIVDLFLDAENSKEYCIFATTSMDWAWGTIIVNQETNAKAISLDSVHPKFDTYTGEQSIAVFKGTSARTFMVSGTQKYANDESSECDGVNKVADVAHTISCFQSAAKAIMNYYDSFKLDYTAIQFHAMAATSCDGVDGFFTNGGMFAPLGEKINIFRDEVAAFMDGTFTVPGEMPYCKLTGGSNVQGRMINGVGPDDACTVKPATYTGRFIHLETKRYLRDRSPKLHAQWSHAVNKAYARFMDAESPRRINIVSPNGGETIGRGTLIPITWNTNNRLDADEKLQISVGRIDAGGSYEYIQGIAYGSKSNPYATNDEGSYSWRVRTALAEGDYTIRVRAVASTLQTCLGYSDATFSVVKPLYLTSPNGGETLEKTKTHEIKWDNRAKGIETVDISLHKNADLAWHSSITTVNNTGLYMWTIPKSTMSGDGYAIRIRNTDYTYSNDFSDAHFSIVDIQDALPKENDLQQNISVETVLQGISVTSPNGGEVIGQGTNVPITWAENSIDNNEKLEISVGRISPDGSYNYIQGISYGGSNNPYAVNSDRSYVWKVQPGFAVGEYVVRIRPLLPDFQQLQDISDSSFFVVKPFALTFPNGGDYLSKGKSYEIKWDVKAEGIADVYISLHKDANKAWHCTIATVPNTGSYTWTVPNWIESANEYKVRIENTDNGYSRNYSNAHLHMYIGLIHKSPGNKALNKTTDISDGNGSFFRAKPATAQNSTIQIRSTDVKYINDFSDAYFSVIG